MSDQAPNTNKHPVIVIPPQEVARLVEHIFHQRRTEEARLERAAAAARLTALADDARQQYLDELKAGGEPVYPAWVDDITILVGRPGGATDDARNAERYRAWRDAAVANSAVFVKAMRDALPPEAREGNPRWPTAGEWDVAIDAAISAQQSGRVDR
ncbi:MAG: hypothetical protein OJK14_10925 [Achromobacter sp.]|uniref:hypothetical protein n=1 Tax=Achromobacter sp. TaxID=134375 RepID=UPI002590D613|nr:hypothetical protein [Achromobacter sp.]MCW0207602.1 hypothetical protein [Achromobacter sp.]